MKIALFSDVHANLPALKSCFKSMDEQKPDAVYYLDDSISFFKLTSVSLVVLVAKLAQTFSKS
jgi:predicted phosphodiesterase